METAQQVTGILRDLVIILFGVIWIAAGVVTALIAWYAYRFVRSLPRRAEPATAAAKELLEQVNKVVGTAGEGARVAAEATAFVSDRAVQPTIRAAAVVAGIRQFFRILIAGPRSRSGDSS